MTVGERQQAQIQSLGCRKNALAIPVCMLCFPALGDPWTSTESTACIIVMRARIRLCEYASMDTMGGMIASQRAHGQRRRTYGAQRTLSGRSWAGKTCTTSGSWDGMYEDVLPAARTASLSFQQAIRSDRDATPLHASLPAKRRCCTVSHGAQRHGKMHAGRRADRQTCMQVNYSCTESRIVA